MGKRKLRQFLMGAGFLLLFMLMPAMIKAEAKEYQGYTYQKYYSFEEGVLQGIAITGYHGTDTTLSIPEQIDGMNVVMVEIEKFAGLKNVEKIILPQFVREIYSDVFYENAPEIQQNYIGLLNGFDKLSSIEVADTNPVFADKDGILYSANWKRIYLCPPGREGAIIIPDTVTTIWECAFFGCGKITSVIIPKSVVYIHQAAFVNNAKLATISVDKENNSFVTVDNVLFDKDVEELYVYPGGKGKKEYQIPEGVTTIKSGAFMYDSILQKVTTPNTLETIENDAFSYCSALKIVDFKKGLRKVCPGAFANCSKLSSVTFREGMREIGYGAYKDCSNLKNVMIPSTVVGSSHGLLIGANRTVKVYSTQVGIVFSEEDAEVEKYVLYAYKNSNIYKYAKSAGITVKSLKAKKDDSVIVKQIMTDSKVKKGTGKPNTKWYHASQKTYKISTPDQLAGLAKLVNKKKSFKDKKILLTADLDLKCYKDWTPIGKETETGGTCFEGTFDGQGHTIYNLTTTDVKDDYQALFGRTGKDSSIMNLNIKGANIKGDAYCAVLVSVADGSLNKCKIYGAVNGRENVGGIAGSSFGQSKIIGCIFSGKVKGNTSTGGIAGESSNTISKCTNKGAIYGNTNTGGIVGNTYGGNIKNCANKGNVIGDMNVGGICGRTFNSAIDGGENKGKVIGNKYVGGVVGQFYFGGTAMNVVNSGVIKGNNYVGGITGYIAVGLLDKCNNKGSVSGISRIGGIIGQIGAVYPEESRYNGCKNSGKVKGKRKVGPIYGEKMNSLY